MTDFDTTTRQRAGSLKVATPAGNFRLPGMTEFYTEGRDSVRESLSIALRALEKGEGYAKRLAFPQTYEWRVALEETLLKTLREAIVAIKAAGNYIEGSGNKTEPPVVKQGTTLCRHGVPTDERCQLCRDELIYIPEEKK